ncbi:hypothetical protein KCU91_g819, partial [Aureobasidium melanogenum]
MTSRNVPPHIDSPRNLAIADATNTTNAMRGSESLSFSNIHVSIDTNNNSDYNHNPHNTNPLGQIQSGRQTPHPTAEISHDIPTAPRARPRRIFDRSAGRYVRPMGPARSNSALELRQASRGHVEHMHSGDSLTSRTPTSWQAVENYLSWLGPLVRPMSLDTTALENPRLIPTQPQVPISRLRPVRKISKLVSLTDIATRFGVEQVAIQTLNASADEPGALKFIVLFENERNDNHGCYHQLVVFVKVNLHLLPGHDLPYPDHGAGDPEHEHDDHSNVFPDSDPTDLRRPLSNATEASDVQPVAIFSQVRYSRQSKAFQFLGWYEIEETEFFAPKTSALVKMLEQRSGRASRVDLESEWAKIRLLRQIRGEDV